MKSFLTLVALLLLPFVTQAQVRQSGTVTPGHASCWTTTGVVQDCGTPAAPLNTGGIGVISTNQQSICTQNAATGQALSKLCLGTQPTEADITLQNYGGGAALPLYFIVNGVKYPYPGPSAVGPMLNGTNFGIKANGVTPDDLALQNAIAACAQQNATLWLPPGKILLTGLASMQLQNCGLIGSNIPGPGSTSSSYGTTILLTSTTTTPFIVGSNWSVQGINFYWPNQTTGTTVYPALFADAGAASSTNGWFVSNISVVNPYNVFQQQSGNSGWSNGDIVNSSFYAINDVFQMYNASGILFSNDQFSPGQWLGVCDATTACKTAIDAASNTNSIIHAVSGGTLNIDFAAPNSIFDWRYAIRVDSGGGIGLSHFYLDMDGVLSALDNSSGGTWGVQNNISGNGDCGSFSYVTNAPKSGVSAACFSVGGTSSGLSMTGWTGGYSTGSYIVTAGGNVFLNNVTIAEVGTLNSTGPYYGIQATANPGGLVITVQNSFIGGAATPANAYGIGGTATPSRLIVEGTFFGGFEQDIDIGAAATTIITGNWSASTAGSTSVTLTGNNPVVYGNNFWDVPPVATVTSCGSSPSVFGAIRGTVNVGNGSISSCSITPPFVVLSQGNASCVFTSASGIALSWTSSGTPPTYAVTGSGLQDTAIRFDCGAQQ